jgi:hypothetical protein
MFSFSEISSNITDQSLRVEDNEASYKLAQRSHVWSMLHCTVGSRQGAGLHAATR